MENINYNYDREADVLYISFGRSEQVVTVELSDHLIMRLDLGKATGIPSRAIGMTLLFRAALLQKGHNPLALELTRLQHLSSEIKGAIVEVLSKPPVSELLSARLEFTSGVPPLPELLAA